MTDFPAHGRHDAKRWVEMLRKRLQPGDYEAQMALSLLDLDSARYHLLLAEVERRAIADIADELERQPAPGSPRTPGAVTDRPHTLGAATPTPESK